MSDVDALAATLDERYGRHNWNLWSASIGGWVVKLNKEKTSHYADTIGEALQAAIDYKPLPVVPRRPIEFLAANAEIYKSASLWRVRCDGRDCCVGARTKRAASIWCERAEYANKKAIEDWETNHGWTLGKQEGVDFRYE